MSNSKVYIPKALHLPESSRARNIFLRSRRPIAPTPARRLSRLGPAARAQHAHAVAARLDGSHEPVRSKCLLGPFAQYYRRSEQSAQQKLTPTIRPFALEASRRGRCDGRATGRAQCINLEDLENSDRRARQGALKTLGKLEPATLAQHAGVEALRLEDSDCPVRKTAVETRGNLEPATLALHAGVEALRLEDSNEDVRKTALQMLGKLAPATLARHADSVIATFEDSYRCVRREARRLSGRLRWYRCRLRLLCVERLALYWYALPYRPSGRGHARDVQEWDQMSLCDQDQSTPAEKRTRHAEDGDAAAQ